ncbi:SDR family oxidoreductase [Pseudothauera nasutitermitis]|uniref:SDR family oxidoreductase n=1 Tax=Pseudothauera nasutitermitis TaxID=2565930 RepID=A0A4S4B1V2_9RHOO|nr:SDR family oxidoreductase [Pseudothauera nasutitermitis]THF66542.1 SDR family oxidoreductase [Pseudothauera nasutitermitis]
MTQARKTVLITGASSGLGAGMARQFAARGYDLALCARRTERLQTLQHELRSAYGVAVEIEALDVNEHAQVFAVFTAFAQRFGRLDRVIVNAGIGEGRRIGTGHFAVNKRTAETNFIAALAQCEAAVEIFRRQNSGHLVVMSSMSAKRGLPRHLTTYAASKAAVAHLAEGIRAELLQTPIQVSTLYPGYIRTELNAGAKKLPFEIPEALGCQYLVQAIERAPHEACVPGWPWALVGRLMQMLPLRWVARFS